MADLNVDEQPSALPEPVENEAPRYEPVDPNEIPPSNTIFYIFFCICYKKFVFINEKFIQYNHSSLFNV